jgi:RNA polymerase primary sigma factor
MTYCNSIKGIKLLSLDEENRLADEMASGSVAARNKLIESQLKLVSSIVRKMKWNSDDIEDLTQLCNIALVDSMCKFDRNRARLSTFTHLLIKSTIDSYHKTIAVNDRHQCPICKTKKVKEFMDNMYICTKCNHEFGPLAPLQKKTQTISLYDYMQNEEDDYNLIYECDDIGENVDFEDVLRRLTKLDDESRIVITNYYGIDCDRKTFKEIGDLIGISEDRARYVKNRTISKLAHKLNEES